MAAGKREKTEEENTSRYSDNAKRFLIKFPVDFEWLDAYKMLNLLILLIKLHK